MGTVWTNGRDSRGQGHVIALLHRWFEMVVSIIQDKGIVCTCKKLHVDFYSIHTLVEYLLAPQCFLFLTPSSCDFFGAYRSNFLPCLPFSHVLLYKSVSEADRKKE